MQGIRQTASIARKAGINLPLPVNPFKGLRVSEIAMGCEGFSENENQMTKTLRTRNLEETKRDLRKCALCRRQTNYIDVCLIHYCDSEKDWQAILDNGILDYAGELKKAGKIGHIGLSFHNPVVARKAVETGRIEVLIFSVYPCYDLQPADEDVGITVMKAAEEMFGF